MANYQTEDNLSEKTGYIDLLKGIWPFVKKYRLGLSGLVTVVVLHSSVGRLLPLVMGKVVDDVIIAKKLHLLWIFCATYLGLEIVRFILICTETYFFQIFGLKIIHDMRSKLFLHMQNLPIAYFDRNPVGRIVTRITNDFSSLSELFTAGIVTVFVDIVSLIAIVVAMFLINVKLTLLVLSISPLMLWSTFYLSGKARTMLTLIKKRGASLNAFISENIMGMKVTQLYVQEKKQNRFFQELNLKYKSEQLENIRYLAWLHPILNGFNAFTVAMALYAGGIMSQPGEGSQSIALPMGLLVAFLTHVQDFLPPLRNILEKYQTFQSSLASAERIFTVFDQPEAKLDGKDFLLPPGQSHLKGKIEFRNVCFSYTPENGDVIKDLSFVINPGEKVAIVGATGSGKTTVIQLLQKFYEPKKGQIFIDDQDIQTIATPLLRKRLGLVQQDFFTFRGTVSSNIDLDDPAITKSALENAARRTQCLDLLKRDLGGGEVQEKGANLSVGERQLLGFARALAFDPDILVLDEATAHIDIQSEKAIQEALKVASDSSEGKRTTLIIAHRLSTIEDCDRIIVLEKGRLIEVGNHTELLAKKGAYSSLHTAQFNV